NVLGFPYIFRGALDVRATTINEEMKIAAAHALAELAREDVPDEVALAYRGARPVYGPDYIIPVPFDPRLISRVSSAVAEAAVRTGVARREMKDADTYRYQLSARLDPSALLFQSITASVRANPKRVVFAEGEEESVIRAAASFQNSRLGTPGLALYRPSLSAPATARRALSRLRAHGGERPQYLRFVHGGGRRCRCDGHRRYALLLRGAQRRAHRAGCAAQPAAHRRDPHLHQGQGGVRG